MGAEEQKISRILEFWRNIETLTPFALREENFEDDPTNPPSAPRMSVFKWDRRNTKGRKAFEIELSRLPEEPENSRYIRTFTVCLGVVHVTNYVKRVEDLLKRADSSYICALKSETFEHEHPKDFICLGALQANHFGKIVHDSVTASFGLGSLVSLGEQAKRPEAKKKSPVETCAILETECLRRYDFGFEHSVPPDVSAKEVFDMFVRPVRREEIKNGAEPGTKMLYPKRGGRKLTVELIEEISEDWLKQSGIEDDVQVWVVVQHQLRTDRFDFDFMNSPYVRTLENLIRRLKNEDIEDVLSPAARRFFNVDGQERLRYDILRSPKHFLELADPEKFNFGRWPSSFEHPLTAMQQIAVSSMIGADSYYPIVSVNGPPGTGKTMILRELIAHVVVCRAYEIAQIPDIVSAHLFSYQEGWKGEFVPVLKKDLSANFSIVIASNNNNAVENITKELPFDWGLEGQSADYFAALANRLNSSKNAWGLLTAALGKGRNWLNFSRSLFQKYENKQKKTRSSLIEDVFASEIEALGGLGRVHEEWHKEKENFLKLISEVRSLLTEEQEAYRADVFQEVKGTFEGAGKKKNPKEDDSFKGFNLFEKRSDHKGNEALSPFLFSGDSGRDNHLNALYTSTDLDIKRTALFLSGLRLHKLTILSHSGKFIQSFIGAAAALYHDISSSSRARFLGTINFLVPAISTTFAASPLRFGAAPTNSIAYVVVDEASQATPQSALCLMQKAKRLIVLGDPQQLRPVVGLPEDILAMLEKGDPLLKAWSPEVWSLQKLSDNTQDYGAWIGEPGEGSWSGLPLRLQRRSSSPMFDICNAISYDGQMVLPKERRQEPVQPEFLKSFWMDVVPTQPSQSTAVAEEIEALTKILREFDDELLMRGLQSGCDVFKSVLICSPFRAGAFAARRAVQHLQKGLQRLKVEKVGTVHVLQGRQADIVIFVLGSKTGPAGFAARQWAATPPNLFNVAISRARETLVVIGNFDDWSESSQIIAEIADQIERYGEGIKREVRESEEEGEPL